MKTLKENDTKVTKDVLLHQIFQEIADENNEIAEDIYLDDIVPDSKTKLSKIREIQKKRQWIFIVILVAIIIYVLFNSTTRSDNSETNVIANDIYTIPQANQAVNQEANQEEEVALSDTVKEKVKSHIVIEDTKPASIIQKNTISEKEVPTEKQTVMEVQVPQSAREKAKKALFMQMQN